MGCQGYDVGVLRDIEASALLVSFLSLLSVSKSVCNNVPEGSDEVLGYLSKVSVLENHGLNEILCHHPFFLGDFVKKDVYLGLDSMLLEKL